MILPILLWVFVIFRYAVNVPWFDDFDPFPDFLRHWLAEASASGKLKLLFQPNNEHRMVFGKLSVLVYYWVTGHLNFTFLQIAGACFTLGTCGLFWISFRGSKINWWYFLPVPFLLFQLQYHLIFLWSICSLQHQPVIFFICLSMFLLSRKQFVWAVLAGVCATFAMSNGIFVWAGGAVVLLWRANFKLLAIWCGAGVLAVGCYFYGMSAQGNESSVDFLMKYPHLSVLGFLTFLGGLFDFFPWIRVEFRSVLPVITSCFVLVWVVIWLLSLLTPWTKRFWGIPKKFPALVRRFIPERKDGDELTAFMLGVMVFLVSNALIIGLLRPRFGFFVMLVSNYKLYPAVFLSVCYLTFLAATVGSGVQKKGFRIVLYTSIFIWLISFYNYLPAISERRKYLLVSAYNQEHDAFGLGHIPFSKGAGYVDDLMKEMVSSGIYQYPAETSMLIPEIDKVKGLPAGEMGVSIEEKSGAIQITDSEGNFSFGVNDGKYPFIVNGDRTYLFKMNQNLYTGRNPLIQFDKGANIEIALSSLVPGTYKLGLIKINGNKVQAGILRTLTIP